MGRENNCESCGRGLLFDDLANTCSFKGISAHNSSILVIAIWLLGGAAISLLSYCLCSLLKTRSHITRSVSYKRVQESPDTFDPRESDSEEEGGEENQFLIVDTI